LGQATVPLNTQVRELIDGKLVIPSIQRDYVWPRAQVPQLLDSLYRKYPVGALLVWKTGIDVPLRKAAVIAQRSTTHQPAYLLDGQQRLTTLAWVLDPTSVPDGRRALDTRFDLNDELFLNPSVLQRRNRWLIPVSDILADGAQYATLLATAGITMDVPEYQTMYDRLHRVAQIRDYQLTVITHESDDYEEVAEIFTRVNQGGRRLSKGDLVHSAIGARWDGGLDEIDSFFEEIDDQNFRINREAVFRLMTLLAGLGGNHIRLIRRDVTREKLETAWRDTTSALKLAIDFLKGECGIPRAAVLTSPNVVVIPAYLLFRRGNALKADEVDALRRWVYTAMAFSRYSNQVETKLDAEAKLVEGRAGGELFDELTRLASGARTAGSPLHPADLKHRYASSPFFNLLYIDALQRGAKDWCSNQSLLDAPMTSTSSIEYHHIFPKARVRQYSRELSDSLANLAFLSARCNKKVGAKYPRTYLPEIAADRLQEQHVAQDATLWEVDAFKKFLELRREALANVLNEMLGLPRWTPAAGTDPDPALDPDDEELADGVD
jgi:hypothetical protein